MDARRPLGELPDEVTFSLDEVADILFAVDIAVARTPADATEHQAARAAQRLITARLAGSGRTAGDDHNGTD